jgi:hypothetical protein
MLGFDVSMISSFLDEQAECLHVGSDECEVGMRSNGSRRKELEPVTTAIRGRPKPSLPIAWPPTTPLGATKTPVLPPFSNEPTG